MALVGKDHGLASMGFMFDTIECKCINVPITI